jgi:hypothetical protein
VRIRIKTLDERVFFSTVYYPEFGSPLTSGQLIVEAVAEEFECPVDDVGDMETDDGDLLTVRGEPVARVIKEFGWRA